VPPMRLAALEMASCSGVVLAVSILVVGLDVVRVVVCVGHGRARGPHPTPAVLVVHDADRPLRASTDRWRVRRRGQLKMWPASRPLEPAPRARPARGVDAAETTRRIEVACGDRPRDGDPRLNPRASRSPSPNVRRTHESEEFTSATPKRIVGTPRSATLASTRRSRKREAAVIVTRQSPGPGVESCTARAPWAT